MTSISPENAEKSPVQKQKPPITPLQITLKLRIHPRKFKIVPEKKRGDLVRILDRMIARLVKLINAKKTRTKVRLRAMGVLNDLIKTSYAMIRDVEIEQLEREIEELEREEEVPYTVEEPT